MDVTQPFNIIAIDMGRIFLTSYVYCIVQVLCSLEMIWEISRTITVLNLGTLSTHILSNKTFANVVFHKQEFCTATNSGCQKVRQKVRQKISVIITNTCVFARVFFSFCCFQDKT